MKKFFITIIILCTTLNTSALAFSIGQKKNVQEEQINPSSEQARIMYAQNEIDQALKILKEIPEDERSAEDWLLIGNILQDKERIDEAIYMFNQSINKNPKYYKAHYNLGYIYLAQEKPNMALSEFKLATKYKPDFAYGYYNIGCTYLKLKKYGQARYNFFKALDLKANEPNIYYNLSYTFKQLGKEKQAQNYLDLYNKMTEDHEL